MLVYGKTREEHNVRLNALLQRLDELGLTVNIRKCHIGQSSVEFFGLVFSVDGIRLSFDKTKALKEAKPPTTPGEVSSLLGLSTYCSRFIKNHATITDPLRKLTRSKADWKWTEVEKEALEGLKDAATGEILSYFNIHLDTLLIVDASPIGLGAILVQVNPMDEDDVRIIAYASRSLSDVERRYSQLEKECLAMVYGCEKFHVYVYGREFLIDTDAKALAYIFNNPVRKTPVRIERWSLRLMPYNFKIRHRPGIGNPADYLSRQPVFSHDSQKDDVEDYVNYLFNASIPKSITHDEIVKATDEDEVLQELIRRVRGAKFNLIKRKSSMFDHVFHELSVTNENMVMRQHLIVIPSSLQSKIVDIAHDGHQGITKTKELLRTKVWFPRLDKLVEQKIDSCQACQINHPRVLYEPLKMSNMPNGPWEQVDIDFYGPTPSNTDLLVLVDQYSRYALVKEVTSKKAEYVIPILHEIWSTFGIPVVLKSDNGPPFTSIEFSNMCKFFGIKHQLITPYWPRANGEVERFNRNLTKVMKNAAATNCSWKKELNLFLGAYRATPHSSTGVAPSQLIFKFNSTSRLILLVKSRRVDRSSDDSKAIGKDNIAKARMKEHGDKHLKVHEAGLQVGDMVLFQPPKQRISSKLKPTREIDIYRVDIVKGSNVTATSTTTNRTINRLVLEELILI